MPKWLKKEGDVIKSGDVIAEIETDKATMEVEAVDEGTLLKIVVPEGTQGVKVNAVIAVIGEAGEALPSSSLVGEVAAKQPEGGVPRRCRSCRFHTCRTSPLRRLWRLLPHKGGGWGAHLCFPACPPHRQRCRC